MFASGQDENGRPRITSEVCPNRVLLADAADPVGFVHWWLEATRFDPFTGFPGLPEWPYRGGHARQPAVVTEAVAILRSEWQHLPRAGRPKEQPN